MTLTERSQKTGVAVCIPTHERPELLEKTLGFLARQTCMPEEVVVSDSSAGERTAAVVERFASQNRDIRVLRVSSNRRSLPWQRWWAFLHSSSEIVLFLDDDIRLEPAALAALGRVYREAEEPVAGVGLQIRYEGPEQETVWGADWRARILGISGTAPGKLTPGGITITPGGQNCGVTPVDWLSGGAMSFRRGSLEAAGECQGLHALYDLRIGSAEDSVLSVLAARSGRGQLLMLNTPLAFHPPLQNAVRTADSHDGWRKGLRETVGRACTMRWLARDRSALRREWRRTVLLELVRAGSCVLRRPFRRPGWERLAGSIYGACLAVFLWPCLSDDPRPTIRFGRLPGVAL